MAIILDREEMNNFLTAVFEKRGTGKAGDSSKQNPGSETSVTAQPLRYSMGP